jgi:hypothetical protein
MGEEPHRLGKIAEDLVASLRRIPSEDPPRMRRRETTAIGRVVEALQIKYGIGRATPEQAIRERWAEIVGPANASYSNPVRVEPGGRLLIHVSHAVVRNELFMNKEEILGRIRQLPGCDVVRYLFLVQG